MKFIENTLLNGQVTVKQPENGYRTAIDPIMLAAACHPHPDDHIVDLGCGVGTIGLCLNHFDPGMNVTGYEIQPELAEIAGQNLKGDNFKILNESIDKVEKNTFHVAVMNPPYYEDGQNISSPDISKATAHSGVLENWFKAANTGLRKGGYLYGILPAIRFDDVIKLSRKHQFGALQFYPLFPKLDKPAKRIIFQARKHKSGQTVLHSGLVLHRQERNYTDEAAAILNGETKIKAFLK